MGQQLWGCLHSQAGRAGQKYQQQADWLDTYQPLWDALSLQGETLGALAPLPAEEDGRRTDAMWKLALRVWGWWRLVTRVWGGEYLLHCDDNEDLSLDQGGGEEWVLQHLQWKENVFICNQLYWSEFKSWNTNYKYSKIFQVLTQNLLFLCAATALNILFSWVLVNHNNFNSKWDRRYSEFSLSHKRKNHR